MARYKFYTWKEGQNAFHWHKTIINNQFDVVKHYKGRNWFSEVTTMTRIGFMFGIEITREDLFMLRNYLFFRLCSHQRHSRGRPEHLLLDPLHLHHPQRILEEDWYWRGSPGYWQDNRPGGEKIRQILPVGLLLPLLPGKAVAEGFIQNQISADRKMFSYKVILIH